MIKAPVTLQDLRRKIYVKAKAEPSWRFWGLYVHVYKLETLREAYRLARQNNGAPGIDGVTFAAIEEHGVDAYLEELSEELASRTYRPQRVRKVEIPKNGDKKKVRVLSIPTIRDRVVQGALKLILEPIFEADFQSGSYGYRPKKAPAQALERVAKAIIERKTYVIDLDLRAYFDSVRHHIVLRKVAERVQDDAVLHLLKMIMQATGKVGVPQGGVISPLLSNLYLNEVDRMLERAREVTRDGKWTRVEYARFADDLVVLVDAHPQHIWLRRAVEQRLREELAELEVEINEEKTSKVDLEAGEAFSFLGFEIRRVKSRKGRWVPLRIPKPSKRIALQRKMKEIFGRTISHPLSKVIEEINPILRGWVSYFAVGHSSRCFSKIRDYVEKRVRIHLGRARQRRGLGWKRWSRKRLYDELGLFNDYRVKWYVPSPKALPAG